MGLPTQSRPLGGPEKRYVDVKVAGPHFPALIWDFLIRLRLLRLLHYTFSIFKRWMFLMSSSFPLKKEISLDLVKNNEYVRLSYEGYIRLWFGSFVVLGSIRSSFHLFVTVDSIRFFFAVGFVMEICLISFVFIM